MSRRIDWNPDEEHLRLLALFHYILAGMNAIGGCMPIIHITLGIMMLTGAFDAGPNPPPPELGLFFLAVGGSISLTFWTLAALKVLAGRCLATHRWYRYCFAIAILECLQMPTGTVLGVFTIIVLTRDSVKALFAGIRWRDPRLAALDDFTDDAPPAAAVPPSPTPDAIRESTPPV
jgi:hypothetical protein